MALGQKLQTTAERVNKKLGKQGGSITFRIITEVPGLHALDSPTITNTDTVVADGISVSWVNIRQLDKGGQLEVGDLRLIVPGHLVAEATLRTRGLYVIYKSQTFSVIQANPTKLISGVPVKWEVLARLER